MAYDEPTMKGTIMNTNIKKFWNDHKIAIVATTASITTVAATAAVLKNVTIITPVPDAVEMIGDIPKNSESFDALTEWISKEALAAGKIITPDQIEDAFVTYTFK